MKYRGKFVTLDGPAGVGKSTTIDNLQNLLISHEIVSKSITQPSKSEFGQFIRSNAHIYGKEALACMVAADRYDQEQSIIMPSLRDGINIICDRYVPSSFVLQGMDGVDESFIRSINSRVIVPDYSFILTASPDIIETRLNKRGTRHTFKADMGKSAEEVSRYERIIPRLGELGYNTTVINVDTLAPSEVAEALYEGVEWS